MEQVYESKEKCCGCTACEHICPVKAITMIKDEKGFYYPSISKEKCVSCGLCKQVCSFCSPVLNKQFCESYIARHVDVEVLDRSQSGGMFTALSDAVLEDNGVIFGAALDGVYVAKHKKANTVQERNAMRGSKYIPSELGDAFLEVEQSLKKGKVLFTGTPCQVDGLLAYLKKKKVGCDNLYTVDIICHGTPSPRIIEDVIRWYERKNEKIVSVVYRDKSINGWRDHCSRLVVENGGEGFVDTLHRSLFYNNLPLRPSCYQCSFCHLERCSDITISDAWGLNADHEFSRDNKGCSLVLINTSKGQELFAASRTSLYVEKVDIKDYMQGNLTHPTTPNRSVEEFWKDYDNKPFSYIIQKYAKNNWLLNYKYILKKVIGKIKR